ncbi:MAG: PaaI family thioesterase [Pseudoxanthomonas sp.]
MNLVERLPPGLTGLEQLRKLVELGSRPPIGETMDFTLVEAEDGFAVFESVPSLRMYNPIGSVHGGYAATLLDSACGCAVHSKLSPTQAYTTLELKTAYHKGITHETGRLRAEGRVLGFGRRAAFAEAKLVGVDGRLYASATSTLLVMER